MAKEKEEWKPTHRAGWIDGGFSFVISPTIEYDPITGTQYGKLHGPVTLKFSKRKIVDVIEELPDPIVPGKMWAYIEYKKYSDKNDTSALRKTYVHADVIKYV